MYCNLRLGVVILIYLDLVIRKVIWRLVKFLMLFCIKSYRLFSFICILLLVFFYYRVIESFLSYFYFILVRFMFLE